MTAGGLLNQWDVDVLKDHYHIDGRQMTVADITKPSDWTLSGVTRKLEMLETFGLVSRSGGKKKGEYRYSIYWDAFMPAFIGLMISDDTAHSADSEACGNKDKSPSPAHLRFITELAGQNEFRKMVIRYMAYHRNNNLDLVDYTGMTLMVMAKAFEPVLLRIGQAPGVFIKRTPGETGRMLDRWRNWRSNISTLAEDAWGEVLVR